MNFYISEYALLTSILLQFIHIHKHILLIYTIHLLRYTIFLTFIKAYVAVLPPKTKNKNQKQETKTNKTGDLHESAFYT